MARYQERWARKQERWARKRERWAQRGPGHGIVGSVAVIALGVLFLLDNLGIVPFREVWRYWPVILIALGVVRLVDSHGTPSVIWGAMLAGIGGLLLLDNLQIIVFDWRLFWPAILIAIGILMLIRTTQFSEHWASVTGGGPAPPDSAVLNMWAMFSGSEQRVDAQNFRGGHIRACSGGVKSISVAPGWPKGRPRSRPTPCSEVWTSGFPPRGLSKSVEQRCLEASGTIRFPRGSSRAHHLPRD